MRIIAGMAAGLLLVSAASQAKVSPEEAAKLGVSGTELTPVGAIRAGDGEHARGDVLPRRRRRDARLVARGRRRPIARIRRRHARLHAAQACPPGNYPTLPESSFP